MGKPIPQQMVLEMGLTLDEFVRSLPSAIAPSRFEQDDRCFTITHRSGRIEIQLHATAERCIGALALPATPVEFAFVGLTSAERCAFMARFDRYFHRGGG